MQIKQAQHTSTATPAPSPGVVGAPPAGLDVGLAPVDGSVANLVPKPSQPSLLLGSTSSVALSAALLSATPNFPSAGVPLVVAERGPNVFEVVLGRTLDFLIPVARAEPVTVTPDLSSARAQAFKYVTATSGRNHHVRHFEGKLMKPVLDRIKRYDRYGELARLSEKKEVRTGVIRRTQKHGLVRVRIDLDQTKGVHYNVDYLSKKHSHLSRAFSAEKGTVKAFARQLRGMTLMGRAVRAGNRAAGRR